MKNDSIFLLCVLFALLLISGVLGDELLKGGNMEDASAWNVSYLDSQDTLYYEFNYPEAPTDGAGGSLWMNGSATAPVQVLFWQEVVLKGGETYDISGIFSDLTGGNLLNFWAEILLSTEAPPESLGTDYGGETLLGFNTWDGCGNNVDGMFQDHFCKGSGPVFTAPDASGEAVTYYFAINIGIWTDGAQIEFEVLVDELSLVGESGATLVGNRPGVADQFELHQNYPNPFNPATRIPFSLPVTSNVKIEIYNMLGEYIATLIDREQLPGENSVVWDGRDYSGNLVNNGVYIYKMQANGYTKSGKMILLK